MDDSNAPLTAAHVDDLDGHVDLSIPIKVASLVVRIQIVEDLKLATESGLA